MAFLAALAPMMAAGTAAAGTAATGMSALGALSAVMGVAGSAVAAMGTIAAGNARKAAGEEQARQLEFQGDQNLARGKWERAKQRHQADLAKIKKQHLMSSATAKHAFGGFLPGDHSSSIQISELERWGSFDEMNELAGGEMAQFDNKIQAQNRYSEATMARFEGASAQASSRTSAMGTMVGGIGSMFGKFSPPSGQGVSASSQTGLGVTTSQHYWSKAG